MNENFKQFITNKTLWIPFFLWLSIQLYKTIYELIKTRRFNFKRMMGAGGMPSSHSAVVSSLAILTGKEEGFDSSIFAIALIFAFVVMYDAAGVRRAAGKQATILNKIISTPGLTNVEVKERLVEALGHSPFQVIIGSLIGIVVGIVA